MELLNKIQRELKVPKGQFNAFAKYNYRNCEDILEAVKPLLGDAILTLSDEVVEVGGRCYVKATATLTSHMALDEQAHTLAPVGVSVTAYAREALDKKGMDEAQITGAASSYARKYALCGLFAIDDGEDADKQDNTAPKASGARSGGYAAPVGKVERPGVVHGPLNAKKKLIAELLNDIALVPLATKEEFEAACEANTGFTLEEANLDSIIDALETKKHINSI